MYLHDLSTRSRVIKPTMIIRLNCSISSLCVSLSKLSMWLKLYSSNSLFWFLYDSSELSMFISFFIILILKICIKRHMLLFVTSIFILATDFPKMNHFRPTMKVNWSCAFSLSDVTDKQTSWLVNVTFDWRQVWRRLFNVMAEHVV